MLIHFFCCLHRICRLSLFIYVLLSFEVNKRRALQYIQIRMICCVCVCVRVFKWTGVWTCVLVYGTSDARWREWCGTFRLFMKRSKYSDTFISMYFDCNKSGWNSVCLQWQLTIGRTTETTWVSCAECWFYPWTNSNFICFTQINWLQS